MYTSTDYDNVKNAYLALMTGERTVSVSWGDKTQTFQKADANQLRSLLQEISNDISTSNQDGSFRIVQRGKGL